jgi:hypothetical protein
MYRTVVKKTTETWDDISRKYFGDTSKSSQLRRLNSDKLSGNVLIFEEPIIQLEDGQNIQVYINNSELTGFTQINVFDDLRKITSASLISNIRNDINEFDSCEIYQSGKKIFSGIVKNIHKILNSSELTMKFELKSNNGILKDSSVPFPLSYKNTTAKDFFKDLLSIFNIPVVFGKDKQLDYKIENEFGNVFDATLEESCWNFIIRIAESLGLLVLDYQGSHIYIGTFSRDTTPKLSFDIGNRDTVKEVSEQRNSEVLKNKYQVFSQYQNDETFIEKEIDINYPSTKRINKPILSESTLVENINFLVKREQNKSYKIIIDNDDLLSEIQGGDVIEFICSPFGISSQLMFVEQKITMSNPVKSYLTLARFEYYIGG